MTDATTVRRSRRTPQASPSSVRFVDAVSALATIFEPAVNVVTLRRQPQRGLQSDAERAVEQPSFRKLFTADLATVAHSDFGELCELPHLADDVRFWAECLADLTDARRVGVRLARLTSPMCPRFHVDRVTLRVVTTYVGEGTEVVASEHVDRRRLGHAAQGMTDEASGLLLAPSRIQRARAFDIVLLKGDTWPDNGGRGAVHRSPAASAEAPRLVLTLDPL